METCQGLCNSNAGALISKSSMPRLTNLAVSFIIKPTGKRKRPRFDGNI